MDFFNGQQNYQYPQPNGYYAYNTSQPTYQANAVFGGVFPVSGEQAAKDFPPLRGTKTLLMDTQNDTFYIKAADAMGNVNSFRTFDYTERENNTSGAENASVEAVQEQYVTKQDLDNQINRLKDFIEETVRTTKDKEVKKK